MSSLFPTAGEWVCFRGNQSLDAHSQAIGNVTNPSIAWKQFVGLIETILVVEPGAGQMSITLPGEHSPTKLDEIHDPRWGLTPLPKQTAGGLQSLTRDFCTAYAPVLAGEVGVQKLVFESAFAKPTIGGAYDRSFGRCFTWQDGQWLQAWETEPITDLFQPLPLVGDFDGDGAPEVAILPWKELLILDARSGQVKDRCTFTTGRSYGFFGVYDFDGDGSSEFLVQSDFSKHVEVLGYRNGKLQLLWQREIEPDISDPQTVMRVAPSPAGDIDGDGRLEVLLHLWNGAGDGSWHTTIHDPLTGAVLADLANQRLQGIADINGDGKVELLTIATDGYLVPIFGTIGVYAFSDGAMKPLWNCDHAAWQLWNPPFADNVSSAANLGRQTVLLRPGVERPYVVFRQRAGDPDGASRLSVASWDKEGLHTIMEVKGEGVEALALDKKGNLLLRSTTQPGEERQIEVSSGQMRLLSSQPVGIEPSTATVARPVHASRPTIVVQGHAEEMVAFQPPQKSQQVETIRRWQGRGQHVGWPLAAKSAISELLGDLGFPPKSLEMMMTYASPVLCDLSGDGRRQILYATSSHSGCAQLVAADLDGSVLWQHDFPKFPGSPPFTSNGGVFLWQTGHFTHAHRQDVLVTTRRSAMHSEETFLLSGEDGRELWHRFRQVLPRQNRAVGGTAFAIADLDGDGLDEIVSYHPSVFYILKGNSGENVICMNTMWEGVPGHSVYWGIPIAGFFEGNDSQSLLFATDRASMTGLLRPDGTLVWWDAFDKSPKHLPAVGDFDGDGELEVIGIGYEDGIRCYNAATGVIKWRLATPTAETPSGTASADINGDGRDEAIFVTGKTLYCVGDSGDGSGGAYLWQLDLPTPVGPPTVAILDGDAKASILLVGEDGYVYCVQ